MYLSKIINKQFLNLHLTLVSGEGETVRQATSLERDCANLYRQRALLEETLMPRSRFCDGWLRLYRLKWLEALHPA